MVEANTYDEKIIQGIEQILQDYQDDVYIRLYLKLGEEFYLFDFSNGSGYCLQQDGIHHFSTFHIDERVVPVRKVAEDYFYDCFQTDPVYRTTVTSVKLKLLTDLEEKAKEFRKFPC